ncbi:MAG: Gfo/Idh/MocA family oxidoreductase [Verrucomicrobiae bacterium]|nr:Gfo/Idh/MocA family oxidoreductase [Verrucomicrobiae bacterium]
MKKIIRTAVVGLGNRGSYFCKQYDDEKAGFRLAAVCDLSQKALNKVREKFGDRIAYHTDLNRMLAVPDIDAVLIATSDAHHVAPVLASLRAGKHVLVEKPLCQTLEDALKIRRAVLDARGVFMIGFELRNCPVFEEMKRLIDEGRIGRVMIGHAFDNVSVGGDYYYHHPRHQKKYFRSLLLQKASHSLDLLNWFMGSHPVKVYGIGGMDFYGGKESSKLQCRNCRRKDCPYRVQHKAFQLDYGEASEVEDYCVWSREMDLNDNSELAITYANGGKATFHECHFTPDYSREFWLTGDKGRLYGYYDNPGRFLIRIQYSHQKHQRVEEFKPAHTGGGHGGGDERLRTEFFRRIMTGDTDHNACCFELGYYSTVLAACAEDSIESGLPVNIPPMIERGRQLRKKT